MGTRVGLFITAGLFAIMARISMVWKGIFCQFFWIVFMVTHYSYYGPNLMVTVWDDVYRYLYG